MHTFLSTLILPLPILWLIILIGITGYLLKKKRLLSICIISAIIWLLLITTAWLPNRLVDSLERSYPPILNIARAESSVPVYIMVLGAGHTDDKSLPPNSQLSATVLGRLIEGIRLYHSIQGSKLIFSGDKGEQTESQAVILAQTAGFLGVSPEDIYQFTTTINTADEAATFKSTFGIQNKLYVVTNAIHMPRAMYLFRHEGLNVTAAPTNYLDKKGSVSNPFTGFIPQSDNLFRMETAMHEHIGMLWARL
jgi:uncharacterized SAM-binding protein YcdF (DUF218 family)